eukprot:7992703-Ditylum_brightwellii.AAC.1
MELELHSWIQKEKRSTGGMLQQMFKKYNCTLQSAINDCPDFIWYGIHPSIHQMIPWRCVVCPLRDTERYYFGITNGNSLVEWFDPNTKTVNHCNTA